LETPPPAQQGGDVMTCIPEQKRLLRVLVADDERDTADNLARLVHLWGHDVRQAYDGAAALELASAYHPDVLLLDIEMPKMNGRQVALQLRRQPRFKDTVLIAVTGYADETNRLLWQEAFDHWLRKPVDLSTLETLLLLQQGRLEAPAPPPPTPRQLASNGRGEPVRLVSA
jgi:CheY-like chemotaxis protein